MWSYYGRKKKIISAYPHPEYETIIEPFAGTASYAYTYWDRQNVLLYEKYDKVCRIWWYLQKAKYSDIIHLPDVRLGESLDKFTWLCDEERWLIGYSINNGSAIPKHKSGTMNFNSWARDKYRIASDLHKINHWKIYNEDYSCAPDIEATWFIDPPYQHNKYPYGYSPKPDYTVLGDWCYGRKGQVIACDNMGADWLPFRPLVSLSGQRTHRVECIWTNA